MNTFALSITTNNVSFQDYNISTSISFNNYNQVIFINSYFSFSSSGIPESLIQNKELSDFVKIVIDELKMQSIIWNGEIKIVQDEYTNNNKMVLIYRPYLYKDTSNTIVKDQLVFYNQKNIYRKLLNNLFHSKRDIKQYLVIDEQIL